jgi:hypothetical protein
MAARAQLCGRQVTDSARSARSALDGRGKGGGMCSRESRQAVPQVMAAHKAAAPHGCAARACNQQQRPARRGQRVAPPPRRPFLFLHMHTAKRTRIPVVRVICGSGTRGKMGTCLCGTKGCGGPRVRSFLRAPAVAGSTAEGPPERRPNASRVAGQARRRRRRVQSNSLKSAGDAQKRVETSQRGGDTQNRELASFEHSSGVAATRTPAAGSIEHVAKSHSMPLRRARGTWGKSKRVGARRWWRPQPMDTCMVS